MLAGAKGCGFSMWTRDGNSDFLKIKFAYNLNIIRIMCIFAKKYI